MPLPFRSWAVFSSSRAALRTCGLRRAERMASDEGSAVEQAHFAIIGAEGG